MGTRGWGVAEWRELTKKLESYLRGKLAHRQVDVGAAGDFSWDPLTSLPEGKGLRA